MNEEEEEEDDEEDEEDEEDMVTQCSSAASRPAMTSEMRPLPSQSSTRTLPILAPEAKPEYRPAASDATAVP